MKLTEIANFFNVSERNIQKWIDAGCPKRGRGDYDLKKVFDWWRDNILRSKESLLDVKKSFWVAKTIREELRAQQEKGELIPKSEVEMEGFKAGRIIRDQFLSLPDRLSSLLASESNDFKCKELLMTEINYILENACKLIGGGI